MRLFGVRNGSSGPSTLYLFGRILTLDVFWLLLLSYLSVLVVNDCDITKVLTKWVPLTLVLIVLLLQPLDALIIRVMGALNLDWKVLIMDLGNAWTCEAIRGKELKMKEWNGMLFTFRESDYFKGYLYRRSLLTGPTSSHCQCP